MFCKIPECNRLIYQKEMCRKHYVWDLSLRKRKICYVDTCIKCIYEDNLCKTHYSMANPKKCVASNCTQAATAAKGYCWRHYQQNRRYGELKYTGEIHQGMKNEYEFRDDGCYILFHNRDGNKVDEGMIDPCDYEKVKDIKWTIDICDGVARIFHGSSSVPISRYIMDTPDDLVCDHISGNRRDNRRSNLRNITQRENTQNRHGVSCNNKLGERGISIHKKTGLYKISLMKDGKLYVKYEKTLEKAIPIRDELLVNLFGEYSNVSQ